MPSKMMKRIAGVAKTIKYQTRIILQIVWFTSFKPQDINIGIDCIVIEIRRNKLCVRKVSFGIYIFWGEIRVLIRPLWSPFLTNSFLKFPDLLWSMFILFLYMLWAKRMFWKIPIDTSIADSFNIICIFSIEYNFTLTVGVESLE